MACMALGGSFGAWIGIIWPETDNLTSIEVVYFYIQHILASFLCPLIMYFNHRYDPLRYLKSGIMPLFSFVLFSAYNRYLLTPISAMTWANLNHTLCGVNNDPFYANFEMGKWYHFFAEFYLMIPSLGIQILNVALGFILFGDFNKYSGVLVDGKKRKIS